MVVVESAVHEQVLSRSGGEERDAGEDEELHA